MELLVTCEDVDEGLLHVGRVECTGLDEGQAVALRKRLGLLGRHAAQVTQVGLVAWNTELVTSS